MTSLQATPSWDDVYQLEVTDPAQGGAGGVLNRQAQALLNRADYLNNQLQAVVQALMGKAPLVHQHDAGAIISGVLDPARIPVLPSQNTVISPGDLTALTSDQQALIVQGVIVTTTDGWRWVFTGSGDKTLKTSYIQLADITPDWSVIQNKPSSFPPSSHQHSMQDITGLQAAMALPPGLVQPFAGSSVPIGYLMCDGSAIQRAQYAGLFTAIGTTYGSGDGSTTFNLPDLRGRFPLSSGHGAGLSARSLGNTGGEETSSALIAHTHDLDPTDGNSVMAVPSGGDRGGAMGNGGAYSMQHQTIGSSGSGDSFSLMPPFLALNFVIKT